MQLLQLVSPASPNLMRLQHHSDEVAQRVGPQKPENACYRGVRDGVGKSAFIYRKTLTNGRAAMAGAMYEATLQLLRQWAEVVFSGSFLECGAFSLIQMWFKA